MYNNALYRLFASHGQIGLWVTGVIELLKTVSLISLNIQWMYGFIIAYYHSLIIKYERPNLILVVYRLILWLSGEYLFS